MFEVLNNFYNITGNKGRPYFGTIIKVTLEKSGWPHNYGMAIVAGVTSGRRQHGPLAKT